MTASKVSRGELEGLIRQAHADWRAQCDRLDRQRGALWIAFGLVGFFTLAAIWALIR